ncbi:MAG: diaminopimelate decarboxylase [Thiotrichales bacterium]|jgi:diaminopimelate decarboxylase|nr:diaminopimelate decarboxylase [Thiotrichales bacterium]
MNNTPISRNNNTLTIDGQSVKTLADTYGTPCYIYSRQGIMQRWQAFDQAFGSQPHLVCYAVKTNSNLAVLQTLAKLGAGFDIVSGGELARVLRAGGDPGKVVFSGVGKTESEMRFALHMGIKCFNIESEAELYRLEAIAQELATPAAISIRVNPDVDPKTHAYISTGLKENKFGVSFEQALPLYRYAFASEHLVVHGIDCHIGSQLLSLAPLEEAAKRVIDFQAKLTNEGIGLHHIDMGGGLGIDYQPQDNAPTPEAYVKALCAAINQPEIEILIEPGRSIIGNNGILVTKVEYLKNNQDKQFMIVDAAMNDLIRPALYDAWQDIVEVTQIPEAKTNNVDVVGPVCETGDFLGKTRNLAAQPGDYLAILSAGAYGFVMSSNYNTRPRAAEIMVDGADKHYCVRARETLDDLMRGETLITD